ncbi:MAG TPA: alcohol dehydrogenase catalytic domain-containing protein [Acidimicrobiales bacterium]|nr:alcohol dehydrogenase catalytic domain-containing protein [Acidimicrobiales bacterium]
MRAAQLVEIPSTELQLADVPEPELRPLSVIISVEACGICGTDLHIMEGSGYRPEMPFTLGHEPVGTVSAVGPDVDGALVGSRVVPTIFVGCNHCEPCRSGDERLCVNGPTITGVFRQPGGFAERMALMATQLVPVPAQVPLEVAATLVDAGATAHNAVRTALDGPHGGGGEHLVVGAGPVGFLVAELLRYRGAHPVILESNEERRRLAQKSGYRAENDLSEIDGPFSSVIDCAAAAGLVDPLLCLLNPHGVYVSVGYAKLDQFDMPLVSHRELVVRGVRSGRQSDLQQVLTLVADHAISAPTWDSWPLEEINTALASLRAGLVGGKAVIVMDT